MAKEIGPNFANELAAYGVAHSVQIIGTHFTWFDDGTLEFFGDTPSGVQTAVEAVYAAHNPATPTPQTEYDENIAAGIVITSTGTPAVSATYALDDQTLTQVKGLANDCANGFGLPAGWVGYPDIEGTPRPHTEATIQNLYKAMRNLLFALQSQLAVASAGGSPEWPTQTATIA